MSMGKKKIQVITAAPTAFYKVDIGTTTGPIVIILNVGEGPGNMLSTNAPSIEYLVR